MRFIEISGFCVRPDKQVEFQKWVTENEDRIKRSYPKGSEFVGIYAAVFSSEKESGDLYWLETHDSYGALDVAAANSKDPTTESAQLTAEFLEFVDPHRHAPWSHHLLKSVIDATVFDLPTS
jgi:hypothetical protein